MSQCSPMQACTRTVSWVRKITLCFFPLDLTERVEAQSEKETQLLLNHLLLVWTKKEKILRQNMMKGFFVMNMFYGENHLSWWERCRLSVTCIRLVPLWQYTSEPWGQIPELQEQTQHIHTHIYAPLHTIVPMSSHSNTAYFQRDNNMKHDGILNANQTPSPNLSSYLPICRR